MSEQTPASIAERKIRERLAFLALPPAKAQRSIGLAASGRLCDVTEPDQDLSYGLTDPPPDKMADQ